MCRRCMNYACMHIFCNTSCIHIFVWVHVMSIYVCMPCVYTEPNEHLCLHACLHAMRLQLSLERDSLISVGRAHTCHSCSLFFSTAVWASSGRYSCQVRGVDLRLCQVHQEYDNDNFFSYFTLFHVSLTSTLVLDSLHT
jgi:hypothetical protein